MNVGVEMHVPISLCTVLIDPTHHACSAIATEKALGTVSVRLTIHTSTVVIAESSFPAIGIDSALKTGVVGTHAIVPIAIAGGTIRGVHAFHTGKGFDITDLKETIVILDALHTLAKAFEAGFSIATFGDALVNGLHLRVG